MVTIKVNDMHCSGCVERIGKALAAAGIEHSIELETKSVVIQDNADLKRALEELDDLGFDEVEA